LYCIGTGPGNPGLLTREAETILKEVNIVFLRDSEIESEGDKIAENVVKELLKEKEIHRFKYDSPIKLGRKGAAKYWKETTEQFYEKMGGKDAALITMGDPTIFSSLQMVKPLMESKGVEVILINGVSSIQAIAKVLDIPLLTGNGILIVTSGWYPRTPEQYKTILELGDNVIFLMGQEGLKKSVKADEQVACLQAALVRNATTNTEIYRGPLRELFERYDCFRATVVVRKKWQKQ
jgi:precorrin-2/cobalt-factor-2 C20-methyltransferase